MTEMGTLVLDAELVAAVEAAATFRGMSPSEYVREIVTLASRLDAELAADLKEAEDDIAAGRFYTQEQVEAMFNVRREQRNAA